MSSSSSSRWSLVDALAAGSLNVYSGAGRVTKTADALREIKDMWMTQTSGDTTPGDGSSISETDDWLYEELPRVWTPIGSPGTEYRADIVKPVFMRLDATLRWSGYIQWRKDGREEKFFETAIFGFPRDRQLIRTMLFRSTYDFEGDRWK